MDFSLSSEGKKSMGEEGRGVRRQLRRCVFFVSQAEIGCGISGRYTIIIHSLGLILVCRFIPILFGSVATIAHANILIDCGPISPPLHDHPPVFDACRCLVSLHSSSLLCAVCTHL
jgi:hypothetical protein